jgi:phage antirepressor YoqD-like protein
MVIHFLIEKGILYRKNKSRKLAVMSKWIKNGDFQMSRGVNVISESKTKGYDKLHITAKGRDRFSPRIIEVFNSMTESEKNKYKRRMKKDNE